MGGHLTEVIEKGLCIEFFIIDAFVCTEICDSMTPLLAPFFLFVWNVI